MSIAIPNTFVDQTTALAEEVNENFAEVATKALDKSGDTITGTVALTGGGSIAGASGVITGTKVATTSTAADSLKSAGGITAGTGAVPIVDTTGKIPAIDATYFASLVATLAALTMSGAISMADNILGRAEIKDYAETKTAPSISAGTLTLDCELGNVFVVALNANITTLTVTNWPATGKKGSIELWLVADGTQRTVALGSYKSPGGASYVPTATNGKIDVVTLHTYDGGSNVFFLVGAQNM